MTEKESTTKESKEQPVAETKPKKAKKTPKKEAFDWVDLTPAQVEALIVSMANEGKTASHIGLTLRDLHGIPKVKAFLQKTIGDVLNEHNLSGDMPRDLLNLISRSVTLTKHMTANKKDFTAKRGYQLTVSKIRRLVKYYHAKNKLPKGWRYTPEAAALLVK
jgi:small subunit ribosomal protein S15